MLLTTLLKAETLTALVLKWAQQGSGSIKQEVCSFERGSLSLHRMEKVVNNKSNCEIQFLLLKKCV